MHNPGGSLDERIPEAGGIKAMNDEQIRKAMKRLSLAEMDHLQRLLRRKTRDSSEFSGTDSVLKSLELSGLIYRAGMTVGLTHRGKLVAQRL